jgi:hypothetical protein
MIHLLILAVHLILLRSHWVMVVMDVFTRLGLL